MIINRQINILQAFEEDNRLRFGVRLFFCFYFGG